MISPVRISTQEFDKALWQKNCAQTGADKKLFQICPKLEGGQPKGEVPSLEALTVFNDKKTTNFE